MPRHRKRLLCEQLYMKRALFSGTSRMRLIADGARPFADVYIEDECGKWWYCMHTKNEALQLCNSVYPGEIERVPSIAKGICQ